jgi:PAS domain S-box-containing protein
MRLRWLAPALALLGGVVYGFAKNRELDRAKRSATNQPESARLAPEPDVHLRSFAEAVPLIVWRARPDGSVDYFNSRWSEWTGFANEESFGWGWMAALHPDDLAETTTTWRRAVRSRQPYEIAYRLRDARRGGYRWYLARATPQFDSDSGIVGWLGTCTDIDERKRSEANLRLLIDTGTQLIAALGVKESLDAVSAVLIEHDADWAAISTVDQRGTPRFVSLRHRDRIHDAAARELRGTPYGGRRGEGIAAALESGVPHVWTRVPSDWLSCLPEPAHAVFDAFATRSALSVPIRVGHRVAALLTVGRAQADRPFEDRDLPTYLELARRLGIATKNAESYENERRVADSFQRAALPVELPRHPRVAFDAVYEAGQSEAHVGGDWYDAFALVDGRIVVSIGDVSGNGLAAAVTMGLVRQSIRAAARIEPDPVAILDAADRTLRGDDPHRIVTAFVGLLDPETGDFFFAGAGHPPPLLRRPDGSLAELLAPGVPLGLRARNIVAHSEAISLEPGSVIALYTDGLTEATRDVFEGERLVREALASEHLLEDARPALAIQRRVLRSGSRDDVAILTLHFRDAARTASEPESAFWSFAARDDAAAIAARHAFVAALHDAGIPESRAATAELVFGELVSNATRHTSGRVEVRLEWAERRPVLHVLDEGAGYRATGSRPTDVMSESGRGLFLIAMLTEDFNVGKRPAGGNHARAVLACERRAARQVVADITA